MRETMVGITTGRTATEQIDTKKEWAKCHLSVVYFAYYFVEILASDEGGWIPFRPWPEQAKLLRMLLEYKRFISLKARQIGITTICLVYLLWAMLFRPVATVGLFSRGEDEAIELLDRLKKMYIRLPVWMRPERIVVSNAHYLELSNGSWARALSTRKGESWTFSHILFDEFDRFDYADELMQNVKPAADSGNAQIIVISIADKDRPKTVFKNIYRAAMQGAGEWKRYFLSWSARPDRDEAWRRRVVEDAIQRHGGDIAGAMDEINQQYPATEQDAMSPRMQSKRFPYVQLKEVYEEREPIPLTELLGCPAIPGLKIYRQPEEGRRYTIGADCGEGVPGGNKSTADVMDVATGEQVAHLSGLFEPKKVFPAFLFEMAVYYNNANPLIERNNHGHATLGGFTELISSIKLCPIQLLKDPVDGREGWLTSPSGKNVTRGKVAMMDTAAQYIKDKLVVIHDEETLYQLSHIDLNKLAAPEGEEDDSALSFCLVCCSIVNQPKGFHAFQI